jgi:GMP synthase-like glutamine amidotransferase
VKPVAIFRFARADGPGHFATFLSRCDIPWTLFKLDEDDAVPKDTTAFSGVGMMGGPMSVNDDLPWVQPMMGMVRDAVARDVPVIGHCLGGQLMAKTLGVPVTRSPAVEIGWHSLRADEVSLARKWFGEGPAYGVFQWHVESFAIPPGATRVLTTEACPNQAYVLGDRHLGMQFHIELTHAILASWLRGGAEDIAAFPVPTVQSPEEISRDVDSRMAALNQQAERVYERWIAGLVR